MELNTFYETIESLVHTSDDEIDQGILFARLAKHAGACNSCYVEAIKNTWMPETVAEARDNAMKVAIDALVIVRKLGFSLEDAQSSIIASLAEKSTTHGN